jgi:cytochrome c biogenesis protein CcdA
MVITSPLRRIVTLSALATLAMGAIALTGWWHPNAPMEAMQMYLPKITLPTVIAAAAVDGINPCAFTVLLLFITAMLTTMQSGEQALPAVRARLLGLGGIYIAAVFLTYLALGVGLLKTLDFFTREHLPARFGALGAILFGLWMLKDFFLPDVGWKLQAPLPGWDHGPTDGKEGDHSRTGPGWFPDRALHRAMQWSSLSWRSQSAGAAAVRLPRLQLSSSL